MSWIHTADMCVELMRDHLGYERFVAAWADWADHTDREQLRRRGHRPRHHRGDALP
jgi:hypothetical protein